MGKSNGHLTRRQFIARPGAAVAGLAAAKVTKADDAQKPKVTIGSGHWTYTLVEGWGAPPEGMKFEWGCAIWVH